MEKDQFSFRDIEAAADIYCSDCCLSCDECGLKDFINFELYTCLEKVKNKNE